MTFTRTSSAPLASVVSVGTELLLGQTVNRHGAWLSKQLAELGIETSFHLTVADDRASMAEAFAKAERDSEVIFITGGLGPTTDDFTRDVLAKYLGLELVWNEAAWVHIRERLEKRGMHVHEFQKQQAFFPKDAKILENPRGTAHGFLIEKEKHFWFVLPGPPAELQGIWRDHAFAIVKKNFAQEDALIVRLWDTLGYGESEIAVRTERALAGSGLIPGYRVHLPYCEVKLVYRESEGAKMNHYVALVEAAIGDVTALRDQKKSTTLLTERLKQKNFCLADEISRGYLQKALLAEDPFLDNANYLFTNRWNGSFPREFDLCLHASLASEHEVQADLWWNNKRHASARIPSVIRSPVMKERENQELIERAVIYWIQNLNGELR